MGAQAVLKPLGFPMPGEIGGDGVGLATEDHPQVSPFVADSFAARLDEQLIGLPDVTQLEGRRPPLQIADQGVDLPVQLLGQAPDRERDAIKLAEEGANGTGRQRMEAQPQGDSC